jgi:hypothetical protein
MRRVGRRRLFSGGSRGNRQSTVIISDQAEIAMLIDVVPQAEALAAVRKVIGNA